MKVFRVKNFERFQHYKDRSPPWIKLYNELLDDYEFGLLPDATKMHLIAIWLLASRSENKIPFDPKWVAGRINANDPVDLNTLLERGFILLDQELQQAEQVATEVLAECLSREEDIGKRKEEREGERAPAKVISMGIGTLIDPEFQPNEEAIQRAHDQGATDAEIDRQLRKFIAHHQIKQSLSPNWNASWAKWWEDWKPHQDRMVPKPKGAPRIDYGTIDWDGFCKRYAGGMGWPKGIGPDPESLACQCPLDILQKHGFRPVPAEVAS